MQLCDAVDPSLNLLQRTLAVNRSLGNNYLAVLFCILDRFHYHRSLGCSLGDGSQLKVQHSRIRLSSTRLIDHLCAQTMLLMVRSSNLDECINIADSRDIIRNERFKMCFQVLGQRCVPGATIRLGSHDTLATQSLTTEHA